MSRLWGSKKGKVKGEMCGFCRVIIVKDKTHSGMFYSVTASAREEGGKIHTVSIPCGRIGFRKRWCSACLQLDPLSTCAH